MTLKKHIMILPGDGIGPEVCTQIFKLIDWLSKNKDIHFTTEEGLIGGACYDKHKQALTDETLSDSMRADAVLLGAVGGPQYDDVERHARPEAGLLRIRKEMDLFANLRPAIAFDALLDASSLKADILSGLDILIVRELTSGVYFGTPRGMETLKDGSMRCVDTQSYTKDEITRLARVGFNLARGRRNLVHSVEKANVMETGKFWRDTVTALHGEEYSDVQLQHMYADNCAMQLVRTPKQFDVIITDNLFGDILSDTAAMCTGSLGMLPSASLGSADKDGKIPALYEPVHGSAPDIAGQNLANPLATILSFSMMLKYSFNQHGAAKMIEDAVHSVLNKGLRTRDIMAENCTVIGTDEMGDAVINALDKSL